MLQPIAWCAAKEMTEEAVVRVFYDGLLIRELTYSVKDYCDEGMTKTGLGQKWLDLFAATLSYGGAAQVYKSYKLDELANADHWLHDPVDVPTTAQRPTIRTVGAPGNTGITFSLVTEAETIMCVYFAHESGRTLSEYNFIVNGVNVNDSVTDADGKYTVRVTGIAARQLGNNVTVTMALKTGGTQSTFIGSPVSYMAVETEKSNDTNLKAMMKGMYNYHLKAIAAQGA